MRHKIPIGGRGRMAHGPEGSEEIHQTIGLGVMNSCDSCAHRLVCRSNDNYPCVECSQYQAASKDVYEYIRHATNWKPTPPEDGEESIRQFVLEWWSRYAEVEESINGGRHQEARLLAERLENDIGMLLGVPDVKVTLDAADFFISFSRLRQIQRRKNEQMNFNELCGNDEQGDEEVRVSVADMKCALREECGIKI